MANKKGTTRRRKPTAKFKVGDRVVVRAQIAQFEGVVLSKDWDDPETSRNPDVAGWAYTISNDPTKDADGQWVERVIYKRDRKSNIYQFPHVVRNNGWSSKDQCGSSATRAEEVSKSIMEKMRPMITQHFNNLYNNTFASCMNGLLAGGHTDTDFLITKSHELTMWSLKQFKDQTVK